MIVNKNVLSLELILNSDHFQCVCVSVCGCLLFLTSCLLTEMMFLVEIFMSTSLRLDVVELWMEQMCEQEDTINKQIIIDPFSTRAIGR